MPDRAVYRQVLMLVFLMLASLSAVTVAQKQSYFWYFGKNAGLDFTGFDPLPTVNSQMDAPEGAAAISDSTGKLLFYTNGVHIWNSSHVRINSTGLSGDPSSTQSATIVPDPDTLNQYFVFTTKPFDSGSPFNFGGNFYKIRIKSGEVGSVIYDYSAATGKGGICTGSTEKFVAVPYFYAPGKTGYWFLMHEFNSANFIKVKYDGVLHDPEIQAIGNQHRNDTIDDGTNHGAVGQMKVNDAGTRLALAVEGGKFFELFKFSTTTGLISSPMQIPAGDPGDKFAFKYGAYGVEFSPTGRYGFETTCGNYLYGSSRDGGLIYQWDLSLENDLTTLVKTGQIWGNPEIQCGALQIASNGKIYVAFKDQDYLGVINSPMRPDCRFQANGARLIDNSNGLGGLSGFGLPSPLPIQKTPEPFYYDKLCFGDETLFYITDQTSITPNTPRAWIITKLGGGGGTVTKTSLTNELKYKFPIPGNYRVFLKVFKSGNPVTYSRDLTINPLPAVKLAAQDKVPLCLGSSLDLDAGTGAFYEWEDVNIKVRSRTITNDSVYPLMEYRVKVTDYHGCVGWDTLMVEKKAWPTVKSTSSIRAFCGENDGSASVIPNGNIQDFDYRWEGFPEVNSNTLSGLGPGKYIVHVILKNTPCEVADTIQVDELGGSSVKIVSSGDPIVCPGVPIKLSVSSASEIEWISPSGLTGNEVTVTLDSTTLFTVKAISRDGMRVCPVTVTDTIRVFPKNLPVLGNDLTPCSGNPVTIDGGENYIEWSWSDNQTGRFAQVNHDENALVLNAKDQNQCIFTDTIAVHFLPSPMVDLGKDTAVCSKDPITLSGGTGDSYLWSRLDSSKPIKLDTTKAIQVSQTGDYILTITQDGCSLSDTIHVQLNDPDNFRIDSISSKDLTCFGVNSGVIQVFASGEGQDFFYSIDNGQNYFDNHGLFEYVPPGSSYYVRVLEDSVCKAFDPVPVVIGQPDSLVAKFCTLPPTCKDCKDGIITLGLITGGTPPYRIRFYGTATNQDSIIKNLGVGSYMLIVTDSLLCETSVQIVLAEGTRPEIKSSVNEPVCTGANVTLKVTNSGKVEWINPSGISDLEIVVKPLVTTTYLAKSIITDADNFSCENILAYTVEVIPFVKPDIGDDVNACAGDTVSLDGGDYVSWEWSNGMVGRYVTLVESLTGPLILTVTDVSGCIQKDTLPVHFYPYPVVELGKDLAKCTSEPLVLNGGTGDSYLWTSDALNSDALTQELPVTQSGKYFLEITTNGCSSEDSVKIEILDPNSFNIISVLPTDNLCFGGESGSLEVNVNGSGTSFQYSIDGGATYQDSSLFENLPSGEYGQIRVSGDSLCYKDYPKAIEIGQPDSIHVAYRLTSPGCVTCDDGKLILQVSGGMPPYQITLSGVPTGLLTESLRIGTYTIVVTDTNLCTKTLDFELELLNSVPNVITTNGDGVNELWTIPMLKYYPFAIVKVFTGAGKLVFESSPGYPIPWDGRDSGNLVPMGTYYYLINLGSGEKQITGYLTILR